MLLGACLSLVIVFSCVDGAPESTPRRKRLILVSMSGFRYDYVNLVPDTPTFKQFITSGTYAKQMNVPFITNMWPSLWTVATGMYPEVHGILDDNMFDTEFGAKFDQTNPDDRWFTGPEPVWISAEKSGIKTVLSAWPGGSNKIDGYKASFVHGFQQAETFQQMQTRLDDVVQLMSVKGAELALIQLPEPDNMAHRSNSTSAEVKRSIKDNDSLLKYLLDKLESAGLKATTNVIVIGDHGMTDHHTRNVIYLNDYIEISDIRWCTSAFFTSGMLLPWPESVKKVYNALLESRSPMSVYMKNEIPEELHIKNHPRMTPILLIPEEGYRIQFIKPGSDLDLVPDQVVGMHGYINSLPSMKPLMMAMGPDFTSQRLDEIDSVDLYPLMCSLLTLDRCHDSPGKMALSGTSSDPLVDKRGVYDRSVAAKLSSSAAQHMGTRPAALLLTFACLLLSLLQR